MSYVDDTLKDELKSNLDNTTIGDDDSVHERLFRTNGPLGSLSSRMALAYSIHLIGKRTLDDLDILRDIRNKFAHFMTLESFKATMRFESPWVAKECNKLWIAKNDFLLRTGQPWIVEENLGHPRGKFTFTVKRIAQIIRQASHELQFRRWPECLI
jgi:hypothetical protein